METRPVPLREKRSSVFLRAVIVGADGRESNEHRVRNLSVTGACIEHAGELAGGMPCHVRMGAIAGIDADVVWATDRLAGLHFHHAVDLEAARKPRGGAVGVKAGWIAEIESPYRR